MWRNLVLALAAVLAVLAAGCGGDEPATPAGDGQGASENQRTPLRATVEPPPNRVACLGVIGMSGQDAEAFLEERGYRVSWRFQRWGDQVLNPNATESEPTAVGGGRSRVVEDAPEGSVVWDAYPGADAQTAIVALQDADDPNAPRVKQPPCES